MKDKLKDITDSTINELLNNEIILPSSYFQCFDKHAKTIDLEINSNSFEKELSELILDEFNSINGYVNSAVKSIDNAAELTLEAQKAIKDSNTLLLKNLYTQIQSLQKELKGITDNIYKDYLTKVNNKKWLYHKYLSNDALFKNNAIILLIDVYDYDYISNTYSKLIANNLLIFISKQINSKFKEEKLDFEIVRFLTNKFIILINSDDINSINEQISNITNILYNTTLKSNSGVIIKPTFENALMKIKKDDSFHDTLASLLKKIKRVK